MFVIASGGPLAWSLLCGRGSYPLVTFFAGTLLLQSPAIAWRIMGASSGRVLIAAIALPLLVFEPWLGVEATLNAGKGGDLQGLEHFLMWLIVVPVTVTAGAVCVATTLLIKPEELER